MTAKEYAKLAHESIGQVRKVTGDPYFVHPNAVANLIHEFVPYGYVHGYSFDPKSVTKDQMKDASWLHDVIEDVYPLNPKFNLVEIEKRFGENVAFMVWELTDQFTKENYPNWNRAKRKWFENRRMAGISLPSRMIKLADMLDNLSGPLDKGGTWPYVMLIEKKANLNEWKDSRDNAIFRCMYEEAMERIEFWQKENDRLTAKS